jgi:hypothetical protein
VFSVTGIPLYIYRSLILIPHFRVHKCLFHPHCWASHWHPIGIAGGDLCNPRVRRGVPPAEEVLRRTAGALRVPKGPRSTGSADGEIGDLGDLKTRLPEIFHECNMILDLVGGLEHEFYFSIYWE